MRGLLFVVLIAGLFAAGCKSEPQVTKVETPAQQSAPKVEVPAPVPTSQPPAAPSPGSTQLVKLTIRVAPEALSPRGGRGGRRDCPQSQLQQLFGIHFAQPHGCIIGEVESGSAAEQVGLQAGDSIVACNGEEVTCPASLLQQLPLGREPGLVELTIARNAPEKAP